MNIFVTIGIVFLVACMAVGLLAASAEPQAQCPLCHKGFDDLPEAITRLFKYIEKMKK